MKEYELIQKFNFLLEYQQQAIDYRFDGKNMYNTEAILREAYTSLGFDNYLPYANYEGFVDLLFSGAWKDTKQVSILITNIQQLLNANSQDDLETLFRALGDVSKDWEEHKGLNSFKVYFAK